MSKNIVLQEQSYKSSEFFNEFISSGLYNLDKEILTFAFTKEDYHLQRLETNIATSQSAYTNLVNALTTQQKSLPYYSSSIDSLLALAEITRDSVTAYQEFSKTIIAQARIDSIQEVTLMLQSNNNIKSENIGKRLEAHLKAFENTILKETQQEYDKATLENTWIQIFSILLGLPALLWIANYFKKEEIRRKKILKDWSESNRKYLFDPGTKTNEYTVELIETTITNLRKATSFVKNVTQGSGNVEWEGLTQENKNLNEENLVGELLRMQQHMKTVKENDEKRNWTNEGLNHLNTILRRESDLLILSDRILAELIKYIGANQGVLFMVNDSDEHNPYLDLKAAYAFNRKKYLSKQIRQGEGLAGQAWQEAETIYLKEIPQNYVRITSGLGDANPNNILVVPLKHEQIVYGILELASFKLFQPHEIHFVERITENIAVSFAAAKATENTAKLLDESKELSEQMRAQEEEMRQSMEELVATQEELQRNQQETNNLLQGINSTFGMIEYDTNGTIINANENFLQLMDYSLEDIKGKPHQIFMPDDSSAKQDYESFWHKLRLGQIQSGKFKRIAKNQSEVWLHASYVPLKNKSEQIYKVIKLATDITAEHRLQLENTERMEMIEVYEQEMRNTLEEMSAKHEEMVDKERRYLEQITLLETENEKLRNGLTTA
ncbi:GAF domain-containing protein [Cytophagaceae bacterium DM2B3-1]|uniref:GAF domain-containing protein n=1 Tax=Xanthocytophaga flava TaxID=3048013 RepID=A0ABT7CJB0_9BACT|nr:GAF domain-containing protein [Xanthocytophaga flavus]MDJ1493816.1 GAF domain-containing protein [Xanthocytophaga flavus]